jgi:hypothetical protein
MTATVADLVEQTRSMLQGALADEASVLAEPFVAGSGQVRLKYPKKNVITGSVVTCGINTWYVLEATSDGSGLIVMEGYDGGPAANVPANTIVRVRPIYTNWSVFREVAQEIGEMSSPMHGLWWPFTLPYTRNWTDDTYPFRVDQTIQPIRLVRGRYQIPGTQAWGNIQSVEWMKEQGMARVRSSVSDANTIELTYAMPFTSPNPLSMTTPLADLGLTGNLVNIPSLGAAASLSLATEGRRQQPFAQGDPRRATEVGYGANIGVSRMWLQQKEDMIGAELARLTREYGWSIPMPEPHPHYRIGGGWPGGGIW